MSDPFVPPAKVTTPVAQGISRPRLFNRLDEVWAGRVALLVAPAGSGKSTLLAQWAAQCDTPVAWYHAEPDDGEGARLLSHLEAALRKIAPVEGAWRSVDEALVALENWSCPRAVLVIDDLHCLHGSEAAQWLQRLVEFLPKNLRLVAASREYVNLDVSRLRIEGDLVDLGPEDLRFRHWEVEDLFHRHYGERLLAKDLAAVHSRTDGWAAGLQMFHLATKDRPGSQKRRILEGLTMPPRLLRDYLTRNVLDTLAPELREFLVLTSPLGILTGDLCNRLTGRENSAALLAELERRQIFTCSDDDGRSFRYHEVFRSHLEGILTDVEGEAGALRHHRQAGTLLAMLCNNSGGAPAGAHAAALRAFFRAEAWDEASEFLGRKGAELASDSMGWFGEIPAALAGDPWLQLAAARRHVAAGRFVEALEAFRKCEPALPLTAADACHRELVAVGTWTTSGPSPTQDWSGILLRAIRRNPLASAETAANLGGSVATAVSGAIALLAGEAANARRLFDSSELQHPQAELAVSIGSTLATLIETGDRRSARVRLSYLAADAERTSQRALGRLAHASLALTGNQSAAAEARMAAQLDDDRWGAAISCLLEGAGLVVDAKPASEALEMARDLAVELTAGVLEAWAVALLALSHSIDNHPDAAETAASAAALATSNGVRGANALIHLALASQRGKQAPEHARQADHIASQCGIRLPTLPSDQPTPGTEGLFVRCLGGLQLSRAGEPLDISGLRPRARSLLALLVMPGSRPVHWEILAESLWPGSDAKKSSQNLHAAVSAVRRALAQSDERNAGALERRGDTYVLSSEWSDVGEMESASAQAEKDRISGSDMVPALERALAVYKGELLPEAGPAEWVVKERDRLRQLAADTAHQLVELHMARGNLQEALACAQRGVDIEPYREALWRHLIDLCEQTGDLPRAQRSRQRQASVFKSLGLVST